MNSPNFSSPNSDLQFLASEHGISKYGDLYGRAIQFSTKNRDLNLTADSPLLIFTEQSDRTILIIACCYLTQTPFLLLHPDITPGEAAPVIKELQPGAIVGSPTKHHPELTALPSLNLSFIEDYEPTEWSDDDLSLGHPDEIAGFFLTSGSTGTPKVVPVKRRQFLFSAAASAKNFRPAPNRYWLLCLPLNHIGGVSIIIRSLLYGSAIFHTSRFEAALAGSFLSDNSLFEAASLVPTMLLRIMDDKLFQPHKKLKAILLGGGPVSEELLRESERRGVPVVSSYGMTETCAQVAANPILSPSGINIPKSSVGPLFKPNSVEIRDDSGRKQPINENGLIWLKGPQIFDGYANEAPNNTIFDKDGWFNTGDYGHLNRNGHLFIKNRRTDRIVSGGENVSPERVERYLKSVTGVKDCAVLGVADPEWGQRMVALILPEDGIPDTEQIQEQLKQQLRDYERPKEIVITDYIPRSTLGKLQRRKLPGLYRSLSKNVR